MWLWFDQIRLTGVSPWNLNIQFITNHTIQTRLMWNNQYSFTFWQMIVCPNDTKTKKLIMNICRTFKAFKNCLSWTFLKSGVVEQLRPWWSCLRWPIPVLHLQFSFIVFLYCSPCRPIFPTLRKYIVTSCTHKGYQPHNTSEQAHAPRLSANIEQACHNTECNLVWSWEAILLHHL